MSYGFTAQKYDINIYDVLKFEFILIQIYLKSVPNTLNRHANIGHFKLQKKKMYVFLQLKLIYNFSIYVNYYIR